MMSTTHEPRLRFRTAFAALAFCGAAAAAVSADWPQFRGPDGNGHAAGPLPVRWSETEGVRWRTAIHGRAWSSPIVLGSRVWVTTATPDGKALSVLAVDLESGQEVYDTKLFDVAEPQFAHRFNSYASPTPVAEPGLVCVTFGSPGTACLDPDTGKVLWSRRDLECNHFRGAGSSPIIHGNLLIMHFDGSDVQYLVALDKRTGRTVWKTTRSIEFRDLGPDGKPQDEGDSRKAFSTPHVTRVNGRDVLISIGSQALYGYDVQTGAELWRVEERSAHSGSTRPVIGHGLVYYPSGFPRGQLLAVRPDGRGDVTATHVAWRTDRAVPNKPSLLLVGDLLFMISDSGIATCLDAKTGETVWTARVGGNYSASPIHAAGRIYFFSEEGKITVIEAARQYKVVAENTMPDGFMASPAVAGRALILRTRRHLYRIE